MEGVATVPHSTGVQNGELLHRQGLYSVFAGWSSPFVGPWDLVSEVSIVVTQSLESFDLCTSRQILVKRIPVDIGPVCDIVERLCGSLILAHRYAAGRGTLHGITLPRSWFINLSRSLLLPGKDTSYIPHFLNDAIELLRRIDSRRELYNPQTADSQQFKHNGSWLTPSYASVYIARM